MSELIPRKCPGRGFVCLTGCLENQDILKECPKKDSEFKENQGKNELPQAP